MADQNTSFGNALFVCFQYADLTVHFLKSLTGCLGIVFGY